MFKLGDQIIWCGQLTDPGQIKAGTVTKLGGRQDMPMVWVDNQHKPEDCIYQAYCWPASVREELAAILRERERLQKLADDSMKLVYELRNAVIRGERG